MKTGLCNIVLFLVSSLAFAQIDGISYQAVIIDNNPQEIPGVDIPNNNLPNAPLTVRFSIFGAGSTLEYQETHLTETDAFGMINLMIGQGQPSGESPGLFTEIYWSDKKSLQVEIDLNDGNGFVSFSNQDLTYIPYVKHREIVATSTLDVDGVTNLNNHLNVNNGGITSLTGTLNVNNQSTTNLSGDLNVAGTTTLNGPLEVNDLTVKGDAYFEKNLNVINGGPTHLGGSLQVDSLTTFNEQVEIIGRNDGVQADQESYPLVVNGPRQGIAIQLNDPSLTRGNNYLTFFDSSGNAKGRIEANEGLETINQAIAAAILPGVSFDDVVGEDEQDSPSDVQPNVYWGNDYGFGGITLYIELLAASFRFGVNLGAAAGLCVAGDCDDAIWSFVDMVIAGYQFGAYIGYNEANLGVAFESGSADYAEWLQKANPNETLLFGEVVGVVGGKVSKKAMGAKKFMVVSKNPMISGAMPAEGTEDNYVKIAFLGQVPVKVLGETAIGDYILPSGNSDGFAISVSPQQMQLGDYQNIVGVAWSEASGEEAFAYINTAVGINSNDLSATIQQMQQTINTMQLAIAQVNPDYEPALYTATGAPVSQKKQVTTSPSLAALLMEESDALNQKSLLQAVTKVQETQFNTGVDVLKLPLVKEIIENPTPENIEKYTTYYAAAIKKLQQMLAEAP